MTAWEKRLNLEKMILVLTDAAEIEINLKEKNGRLKYCMSGNTRPEKWRCHATVRVE